METKRKVFTARKGQVMGGHAIGILLLEVGYPIIPGNVANASTFRFPVRYRVVRDATIPGILNADPSLLDGIIAGARELEQDGVRAIVGSCGYFGVFQREVAQAVDIPVFMSSLLQVPLIAKSLKPTQKVGIICAVSEALRPGLLESCGIDSSVPYVVAGLEDAPEFSRGILHESGALRDDTVRAEAVGTCRALVEAHPEIGALLLECSDIPPYSKAVHDAVGLPVWDFNTMINWIYHAVVQRDYIGFI